MVNIKKFMIFFILLCCITVVCSYLYYKPKDMQLNDKQIECLEKKIASNGNTYKDYNGKYKLKSDAAVKVFGVDSLGGGEYRVFGYETNSTVVVYRDKYYELSGGMGPFIMDVRIANLGNIYSNNVKFEDFPYGTESEPDILDGFPKKYVLKARFFKSQKLNRQLDKKLQKKTGVKKDTAWLIEINEDEKTFKLFNFDEDGNIIVGEQGKLKDLE